MSQRTLLEFNHDYTPSGSDDELLTWAKRIRSYLRSVDPHELPAGVVWKHRRHHSELEPKRDGLLERAMTDALAPLLANGNTAGVDGMPRVGRATRKKAEMLAQAALAVVRRMEA